MSFLEVLSFLIVNIILPVVVIATLVYLIMLLSQLTQTVKRANSLMDEIEGKIELLDGPINMIVNAYSTLNSVSASVSGALATLKSLKRRKNN